MSLFGGIFGDIIPAHLRGGYAQPTGFGLFINNVIKAVVLAAGLLLFAYLIIGGFRYATAGGDEKAVTAAKQMMTNAIVGLVIIVAAFFIVGIVQTILGISILEPVFLGPG